MHQEECSDPDDAPQSMRDSGVRLRRREMLKEAHMVPLTKYVGTLRGRSKVEVPDFDPFDGGVEALALFLFEKPGAMTAKEGARKRSGSGFISRNNNDESAKATFEFMRRAGLPRKMTIIWNVVPWWNGTRKVTSFELREGAESVKQLIKLLPKLRAVVFVGQSAAKARPYLTDSGLALFSSAHPSPLVRASWPERWRAIPSDWAKVKPVLGLP